MTTAIKAKKSDSIKKDGNKTASAILVSSVVRANLANKRKAIAHTKTRAEVSGGGKKPWRQKGTGRARAGSNRSPIWVGGGITFGPRKERNFSKRVNKRQKDLVLRTLLDTKKEDKKLIILDEIGFGGKKTKDFIKFLKNNGIENKALIVLDGELSNSEAGTDIYNASRNSSLAETISVEKVSAFRVLKYHYIIMTKKAYESINAKKKEKQ